MPSADPTRTRLWRSRILAARAVLAIEGGWAALWPAAGVLGLFVAVSLFGLWSVLPAFLHWALLAAFVAAFGYAVWRAVPGLGVPAEGAALARLEHDTGVAHEPLRALGDTLPDDLDDPLTRRLWSMHRERMLSGLDRIRLAPPRSPLPRLDPWAIRAALLLLLVVAFVHGGGDAGRRLAAAFHSATPAEAAGPAATAELWLTPPPYTRRPPMTAKASDGSAALTVPTGTEALVQLHHLGADSGSWQVRLGETVVEAAMLGPGSAQAKLKVEASGRLSVGDAAGGEMAAWTVEAAPDAAPTVAFIGTPQATHRSVLRVGFDATDDYGLAEIAMTLRPAEGDTAPERFVLAKNTGQPATLKSAGYLDLTAHPLAGLKVEAQLEAVDAAGNVGRSESVELVLPAREFHNPLAKAIIGERRRLVAAPDQRMDVAGRLAALGETEAARKLPVVVPLSLDVAVSRLAKSKTSADDRPVVDMLWELALFIEDGSLSLAERKLRELQDKLQQALSDGTKDEELEQLMKELQQAMDEFLQELTRQAMEQGRQPQEQSQQPQNGQQTVDRQDLQQMLDRAREMMRSGAKDAAKQMLSQLQEMLENLRSGMAQSQPSPGQQALSDLQKMIQLQQQLLDRSFDMDKRMRDSQSQQQGQQQRGQEQQGQQQQGQQQQQGRPGDSPQQAAGEQDALRRALGELMRRMGEAGMEIPRAMGQAELQMRDAKGNLEQGSPGAATDPQAAAVDAMQRAGQAMMDQMREQMTGQQPGPGQGQAPQADGRRGRDPFGRATHNDGGIDTEGVAVPDAADLGRARDVLEELYRRAGDRQRPPDELDYYRRLLDRF